jgi:hypothetical protein
LKQRKLIEYRIEAREWLGQDEFFAKTFKARALCFQSFFLGKLKQGR